MRKLELEYVEFAVLGGRTMKKVNRSPKRLRKSHTAMAAHCLLAKEVFDRMITVNPCYFFKYFLALHNDASSPMVFLRPRFSKVAFVCDFGISLGQGKRINNI